MALPLGEEKQLNDIFHDGDLHGEGGTRTQRTPKDFSKEFEDRVRTFVGACNGEERQLLLNHFSNKIGFLLGDRIEEWSLQETDDRILRNIIIIRIALEEIEQAITKEIRLNKRKISDSDDDLQRRKKMKISEDFRSQRNWQELQLLGQGGFASVKLVRHITSGVVCARKSIRIGHLERQVKELEIHKKLDHHNIAAFLGENRDEESLHIFLEYVSNGTLEDRIGARGMCQDKARFYFTQLIAGVKYLHARGNTHRDLKPENLFVSKGEVIKIGDFGLSGEFVKGQYLSRMCGTSAYIAPEVFSRRYQGEPVDIWACGIILFKLLTGRIPWGRALSKDSTYAIWSFATCEVRHEKPWALISGRIFSIIEKILVPNPEERATVSDIEQTAWFQG